MADRYPSAMTFIDLRSDTVTQPSAAMRSAMASALVGDDGFGDDPTLNELEETFARIVGKEAALFVPSGVMANQIAVRVLTRPGDVIIAGAQQHVVSFEYGASARNSSVQFATVDDRGGVLRPADIADIIDAELDHQPHVSLVSIENSHMPSGGTPWSLAEIEAVVDAAQGRPVHLDGARLFNATVATGLDPAAVCAPVTTVMACLSKGLGAPIGSLLAGPADLMAAGRVERKRLGGTMRQVGVIAAPGLIALTQNVERLADDHRRARRLAEAVAARFPESNYDPASCRTNIVAFTHERGREIIAQWESAGLYGGTVAPRRARLVTHLGIGDDDIDRACDIIAQTK